jgi:hypothetical protein
VTINVFIQTVSLLHVDGKVSLMVHSVSRRYGNSNPLMLPDTFYFEFQNSHTGSHIGLEPDFLNANLSLTEDPSFRSVYFNI